MKNIGKRLLAMLLCAAICVSLLPVSAFANNRDNSAAAPESCTELGEAVVQQEESIFLEEDSASEGYILSSEDDSVSDGETTTEEPALPEQLEEPKTDKKSGSPEKRLNSTEKMETERGIEDYPELVLNEETVVTISTEGEIVYFRFMPDETGTYQFYSLSDEDTYGYLFDSEMNQLTDNDEGGTDSNFMISYDLNAEETYIFGASYYSSARTGSFSVIIEMVVHVPGEPVIRNTVLATCSAEGSYDEVVYCTECGKELSRETIITEKLEHTPGESFEENRVEPTYTEEGSYDEVVCCTVCGEELSREARTIDIKTPSIDLGENYIEAIPAEDGSGNVDVTVYYRMTEEMFAVITEPRLEISWTDQGVLQSGSVTGLDGVIISSTDNFLVWEILSPEGSISFRVETAKSRRLFLDAALFYFFREEEETVVFQTVETLSAHFHADFFYDNEESVTVNGFAPAGSEIRLYLDNAYVSSIFAAENGSFTGTITVPGWEEEAIHCMQARCVVNGQSIWKSASFYRRTGQPELIGMKYYDNAAATEYVDIYAAMQAGETASIEYLGNDDPFRFVLEFANAEQLDRVYVTAKINGLLYRVEAVYDEDAGTYVAEGYFVEGNKRRSPTSIGVEYTPQGTARIVTEEVDISAGGDLYGVVTNDFPNATVEIDEESTPGLSIYRVDLQYDGTDAELTDTAFQYTARAIDYVTGLELFSQYKLDTRYLSYIVPGLDEDRYYLNLDLTDPNSIRILLVDAADGVNEAFEFVISCMDTTSSNYVKWTDAADVIGKATTAVDLLGDMYDIRTDTKELKEEIQNATYLNEEEKRIAFQKADELDSDRMVFTILITMLPLVAGTGGMAAPVALLTSMLWVMESASDLVFDARASNIVMNDTDIDWAQNAGVVSVQGTDGLTYSFDYYLVLNSTPNFQNGMIIGYYYNYHSYLDVSVFGDGVSNPNNSQLSVARDNVYQQVKNKTGITVTRETIRSITYEEGVTGIAGLLTAQSQYWYVGICKITVGSTVETIRDDMFTLRNQPFSAGSIGTGCQFEFGWTDIPKEIFKSRTYLTRLELSEGIRSIGESAFEGCTGLTSLTIPATVASIGKKAFSGCEGIEELSLVTYDCEIQGGAFGGCTALKHVTVGEVKVKNTYSPFPALESISFVGTRTISAYLLSGHSELTEITLPESVTSIGNNAFSYCRGLTSIEIPANVTSIGEDAFECCSELTRVELPEGMTSIGSGAFRYCDNLTGVVIPASVTSLGQGVFSEDTNIKTAGPIGGGYDYEFGWTTEIPDRAFSYCKYLTSVKLPDSVTKLGMAAFEHCESLTEITIPDTVTELGGSVFSNCSALTSVTIPAGVTEINPFSFDKCSVLSSVNFPEGLLYISWYAFEDCYYLANVEFPTSITGIGRGAFSGCSSLTDITIPKNVTGVGESAFSGCTLEEVFFEGSAPYLGDNAFRGSTANAWYPGLDASWTDDVLQDYGGKITWKRYKTGNHCGVNLFWALDGDVLRISGSGEMWNFDQDDPGWYEERESIRTLVIENGTVNVGCWAFNGCCNMTDVTLPAGITSIDEGAFYNCSAMETLNIPASVTRIEGYAFSRCSSLKTLAIPAGVTVIEEQTFNNCSALENVTIPDGVTEIKEYAFYNCSRLERMTIPASVTKIGNDVFTGHYMESICFMGSAPTIDKNAFWRVHGTVYYLEDDPSWTEEVKQDYGGTLTWEGVDHFHSYVPEWFWYDDYTFAFAVLTCEMCGDTQEEEAVVTSSTDGVMTTYTATIVFNGVTYTDVIGSSNITSSSVDFNGKLYLNTYIKLSDAVMADPNAYVSVIFNGETKDHRVAELIQNLDAQGRVKVRQEMFAAMLRDEMILLVFNGRDELQPLTYKETTDVTDGFVYTALEYLKGRQEQSTNPYMVELAKAAELYGTAVQVKFDYHTEQLTTEDIAAMEAAAGAISIPASCAETVTGTLPAGITKRTKTVMFESDNALRQYYYIDGGNIKNYTFTLNGETVKAKKLEAGKYYVQQPNIASALLSTKYTFSVSDGTDTYTIESSALGYAYDRQENSSDPTMVNLSKLLYRYSQAADAYFGQ